MTITSTTRKGKNAWEIPSFKTLRAMTDDKASANNDDDGRQVMTIAHSTFRSDELQIHLKGFPFYLGIQHDY
jgi:hypothetical protein